MDIDIAPNTSLETELRDTIAMLISERDRYLRFLAVLEWIDNGHCPSCRYPQKKGHPEYCMFYDLVQKGYPMTTRTVEYVRRDEAVKKVAELLESEHDLLQLCEQKDSEIRTERTRSGIMLVLCVCLFVLSIVLLAVLFA